MIRPPRLSIALGVLSLLQFVGVFVGAALVYRAHMPAQHPFLQVPAAMLSVATEDSWNDLSKTQRTADRLATRLDLGIELYDAAGVRRLMAGKNLPQMEWMAEAPVMVDGRKVGRLVVRSSVLPHPPVAAWLAAAVTAAMVLTMSSWVLSRSIARPLLQISDAAHRLGEGDLSARVGPQRCAPELRRLSESFDAMAGRLQKLVTAHSELLANVSHELRTPLARARVALDLANEGAILDREAITEITSDLAELEHLIAEVLTTARLSLAQGQAGDVLARLPKAPVDAGTIVDAAAERFRKSHPHIDLQVHSVSGATVVVAETLVRRALDNLLDNAAGHGGGAAVTLTLRTQADMVTFEVRDLGPGLRPEDAERVFEPFYRADPSRSKVGGLGLGLTLVRRVAEAHGGTATLQSGVGQGTTVCVTLPVASAHDSKEQA